MTTTLPRRTAAAARSRISGWGSSGLISTRSVAIAMRFSARADGLRHVQGHLVTAKGRAQLYTLDEVADTRDHLAGDSNAFLAGFFGVVHAAHALHEFLGNGHAQLVDHELGVAVAGERPDAANHRNPDVLGAAQETFQVVEVEDRLGHHVLGAGFHLPLEAADLLVQVQRAGVGAHADHERGLRAHGIAADI